MAKYSKTNLLDPEAASLADTSRVFHVTEPTIHNWLKKGCPRQEDKTFIIFNVYKWLTQKNTRTGLEEEKLKADIEYKRAQTEKMDGQYILRVDHEQLMNSWASSFRKCWAQGVKKIIMHFCNQELDQLHVLFESFGRQLMEVWADSGKDDKI